MTSKSTNNYIVPLSIGPQLARPTGLIRPYVNAGIAAQIFFTESGVEGSDDNFDFANTTNQHDWTSAWVAGGGVYVPVYTKKMSVLIDAGIQYFGAGHARYLRPGSIQDLPNARSGSAARERDAPCPRPHWREAGAVISIVDAKDLQYVLRPTIYRPLGASADRSEGTRRPLGEAVAGGGASAGSTKVDHVPEPSKR